MEQDGGAQEPHETESASEDPDGSPPVEPTPPPPEPDDDGSPRRPLLIGGVIAVVAVVAAIAFTIGGDGDLAVPPSSDEDQIEITLPTSESSVASTTEPAATTDAPPTAATAATTAPPTSPPPTTPPASVVPTRVPTSVPAGGPTTIAPGASIGSIVPNIAAFGRHLSTPQQVQTTVDRLLASGGRHDVADPGTVETLCATVDLAGAIEVSGRWERDGDEIAETGLDVRSAPGFGHCIDNDGEPLEPGSYQFLATDANGTDSAVANFVVGAARLDQRFVNNGQDPVCAIFIAPTTSGFFEDYVFPTPLAPGTAVEIRIADVAQDVEVWGCPNSEVLADFDFDPARGTPRALIP